MTETDQDRRRIEVPSTLRLDNPDDVSRFVSAVSSLLAGVGPGSGVDLVFREDSPGFSARAYTAARDALLGAFERVSTIKMFATTDRAERVIEISRSQIRRPVAATDGVEYDLVFDEQGGVTIRANQRPPKLVVFPDEPGPARDVVKDLPREVDAGKFSTLRSILGARSLVLIDAPSAWREFEDAFPSVPPGVEVWLVGRDLSQLAQRTQTHWFASAEEARRTLYCRLGIRDLPALVADSDTVAAPAIERSAPAAPGVSRETSADPRRAAAS